MIYLHNRERKQKKLAKFFNLITVKFKFLQLFVNVFYRYIRRRKERRNSRNPKHGIK